MKLLKKKGDKPTPEQIQQQKKKSAQDWIPFNDIHDGIIYRKDKAFVSVLRVMPYNLNLQSKNEKKRVISAVHEALNGQQDPFQILCIGRPVDLDGYLRGLQEKSREVDSLRRRKLLQNYIKYVASLAAGGDALERRYYILLPETSKNKQAREIVKQRAYELAENLQRADLTVKICTDQEIIDLLFTFTHPVQAAFERPPELIPNITSQL